MSIYKIVDVLSFNPLPSTIMHIDINSCFATIEQQANPLLRGKPIAVCAYTSSSGCILAPSIEAKEFGIRTGMRVCEGKRLYPKLIVLEPDPPKYRFVHLSLRKIISEFTNIFLPKSIDEFVLDISDYLYTSGKDVFEVGQEIKQKVKAEVGELIRTSIGIGPSRFIAKTASNIKKPDGLEEINFRNFKNVYENLTLCDLTGINKRNEIRLKNVGVNSVIDFYNADILKLKAAFRSVLAKYWHARLRGFEIDGAEFRRRSFGNSFALPHSKGTVDELLPILQKLTEKTGSRLRKAGYKAQGVRLNLVFKDKSYWQKGKKLNSVIFDSRDIFKEIVSLLKSCPKIKPVRVLSESVFHLSNFSLTQFNLFEDMAKKNNLVSAIDEINKKWGDFALTPARMVLVKNKVSDRIAFGGVKEL